MIICLEQGADLRMAQLMPLLLTVSCFSKLQMGFTFLVPAHPGSPGQRTVKRVCVCVYLVLFLRFLIFNCFSCYACRYPHKPLVSVVASGLDYEL